MIWIVRLLGYAHTAMSVVFVFAEWVRKAEFILQEMKDDEPDEVVPPFSAILPSCPSLRHTLQHLALPSVCFQSPSKGVLLLL